MTCGAISDPLIHLGLRRILAATAAPKALSTLRGRHILDGIEPMRVEQADMRQYPSNNASIFNNNDQ
jgi:hypothetical protein